MNRNKLIAGMLAATIITVNISASGVTAFAADGSSNQKEEVVYVMTDAKGSVSNVNVVNIFGKGSITDYGNYSSVKMLNSTDDISVNGDKITFNTDKDKIYYQGTMENVQLPWNIKFTYILDGKELTPEQLAGKSGKLEIRIKIDKNDKASGDFYDDYAFQASLTLDTNKCKNIVADGATLANVGADKQISYTVLPGKGLDAAITAEVTDFEMDAAAINGVMLNLDVDIDDAELMDKVTQIMDASKSINEGAVKLSDGSSELVDGGGSFSDGAVSLHDGVSTLNDGISTLGDGVIKMQDALNQLNSKSSELTSGSSQMLDALKTVQSELDKVSMSTDQIKQLTDSSAAIKEGINDAYAGAVSLQSEMTYDAYAATLKSNGLDIAQVQSGNTATINQLTSEIQTLTAQAAQLENVPGQESTVAQLKSMISSYTQIVTLLTGNNAAISGTSQYFGALSSGSTELVDGLAKLKSNYEAYDAAINSLASSLSDMVVKMGTLKSGINQIVSSYKSLDTGIKEYTDGVASIVAAYTELVTGTNSLMDGSKELLDGSADLKQGASDLYDGIVTLNDGSNELSEGTGEFYEQTDGMDGKIRDSIDEMISSISGGDAEVVSFVSDKNENVSAVQFVIKTAAIEKAEVVQDDTEQVQKLNFWQKLLKLFGVNY